jgi:hypothetical protein
VSQLQTVLHSDVRRALTTALARTAQGRAELRIRLAITVELSLLTSTSNGVQIRTLTTTYQRHVLFAAATADCPLTLTVCHDTTHPHITTQVKLSRAPSNACMLALFSRFPRSKPACGLCHTC